MMGLWEPATLNSHAYLRRLDLLEWNGGLE